MNDLWLYPKMLFHASEAHWGKNLKDLGFDAVGFVTDGPFLYRTKTGQLMLCLHQPNKRKKE